MKKKWMSLVIVLVMLLMLLLPGTNVMAQTGAYTEGANAYANEWYMEPWVWILSGGIFILLFTVIISREDNSDA